MRSSVAVALVMGVAVLAACEKTGEGEYEVQRPTVGVETDTVQTPSVDVGTQQDTVIVTTPTVMSPEPLLDLKARPEFAAGETATS